MSGIRGQRYIDKDGNEVLTGGIKAAKTNTEKYGKDYYSRIGRRGGKNSHDGGFASDKVGKDGLTGRERASIAGAKGGTISRRGPATSPRKPKTTRKADELGPIVSSIERTYKKENRSFFKRLFKR